jgi:hypothetical protein
MSTERSSLKRKLALQSEFNRYEAKYIIPPSMVPDIRAFIRPFCVDDPHGKGAFPEYVVTTLQLDSDALDLHLAKTNEALNRFKMRIRTYGTDNDLPLFLEIKRKLNGSIAKSRMMVSREDYSAALFNGRSCPAFRSRAEALVFTDFMRLRNELDLKPVTFVRYHRESYMGKDYQYARITFDRKLCYRRTKEWDFPSPGVRWRSMDSTTAMDRPFSGVILELKTYRDVPVWMSELTERFNLVRTGFCKYSTAMNLEAAFYGEPYRCSQNEEVEPLTPARIEL